MYRLIEEKWFDENSKLVNELKIYSCSDKKENEKSMDSFLEKLDRYFRRKPRNKRDEEVWESEGKDLFKSFIKSDKLFKLKGLSLKVQDSIMEMTREFISEAKRFDSEVSEKEIVQALRNVWIIAILQVMFERNIVLTKSIFAYSMIYPYSDNFLDDKNIDVKEKHNFNKKLYSMIKGDRVKISSKLEDKVYSLIKMIESEYERNNYKGVYRSLIEIQEGQELSLKQTEKFFIPYETDVLGISIKKGGASVLADGYLIKGKLTLEEEKFCEFYGALLQLIDDFQDLKNDKENGYSTIMSQLAGKYYLDVIVNKLINCVYHLFDGAQSLKDKDNLKEVMKNNCLVLILCSIGLNKEYFNDVYVKEMSKYIPFSIEYLEKLDRTLKKRIRKMEAII